MTRHLSTAFVVVALLAALPAAAADTPKAMYTKALAQEHDVRDASQHATLVRIRRVVAAYETIVRRHPTSGYCDNALWQAANLSQLAFDRFGDDADRRAASRLMLELISQYPTSKLARQAARGQSGVKPGSDPALTPPQTVSRDAAADADAPAIKPAADPVPATNALLKNVERTILPDGVRLTVDLDAEVVFHQEEIANPRRLFFDLKGVRAVPALQDASLKYTDDIVKEVRLGRHAQNTTRLVVDLEGVDTYTVYPLYGPYRLVIDCHRAGTAEAPAVRIPAVAASTRLLTGSLPAASLTTPRPPVPVTELKSPVDGAPALPKTTAIGSTLPPAANLNGKFSLSRQLGLSVSRIVIDAGHGGHDPGAQGNGINEAELTLDVALRLQKLLLKQAGIEVVMTRDTDVFIPLPERTEIANREGADLFLSIHANASRNPQAHGVETYFLNFAMNPEAEAVAARENATSVQSMHSLPDIVKAIALNNKINESRDFAAVVQRSMARKLAARNKQLRDLGVKQAPFVVLIGASMPSVLAEISFVTNHQDGTLLKTNAYRQQIAQALFEAVVNYQQSLKKLNAASAKKATIE